jgi:hypothetical protein
MAAQEPRVFENFASDSEFQETVGFLRGLRFWFGAVSTNPKLPIWQGAIAEDAPPIRIAMTTLRRVTGEKFELASCHVNLQMHGLDGAFHVDSNEPHVTHALNWYVHPHDWPVEFGGYLLVGEDPRDLRAILPTRNSAVLISSRTPHCAISPFRMAGTASRMSLTLKLSSQHAI